MPKHRILIVDDDIGLLRTHQLLLEDEGEYKTLTATSGEQALEVLDGHAGIRLVLTDLSMPGMDGLELLRVIRERWPATPVILMTAFASVRSAVDAMRLGAAQYLTKPVDPDELLLQIERTLDNVSVRENHRLLKDRTGDPDHFDVLVGGTDSTRTLRASIDKLSTVDSTVLIRGETGTGKELVARLIHRSGTRSSAPFVPVNCTAIPGELLESELFGHEKGSFTGAQEARRGRIEEAEGGTLFLDEIGDMPLSLQPKILRFLQERTMRRIGGKRDRRVDVRIIAATHRDLEEAMHDGAFREDLFYRLSAIPLAVAPLRERPEDIPALAEHLLAKIAKRLSRPQPELSPDALDQLSRYSFPGNVRELENLLERALVLGASTSAHLATDDLPPLIERGAGRLGRIPLEQGLARLTELHSQAEEDLLRRAVGAWPGLSNSEIADKLGTNRRVLELRFKHYGIIKRQS